MKCLGVDIGSSSIKIAEVEGAGRTVAITQVWELPLSTEPTKDVALEAIEKLRDFSSQYIGRDVRWIVGVTQNSVSVRLKRFPFTERLKVLKSLPFELEEEIPFDTEDTIFDARTIETFANASDVLAVACPIDAVKEVLDRAKDSGFEPHLVTCEGFALANIIDSWSVPPRSTPIQVPIGDDDYRAKDVKPAHAILHIGHSRSILIAFVDDHPVSIRSIQWGGHDAALAIESVFKVPYVEAIKVLKTKSFVLLNTSGASRDQVAMHKAISDSAVSFIRELRLTLLDLKTSAGADVKDIRLTGGASQIQNLAPWLTQSLEVPVNMLDYLGAMSASAKVQIRASMNPQLESIAGPAIGLALEGMRKPRNPAINLRKGIFTKSNESVRIFFETWKNTMQIGVAIFILFFAYSIIRQSMTASLAERSDESLSAAAKSAANLKGNSATATGVKNYIDTETRTIKNRETLAQLESYIPALDFVLQLSERLPVQLPPREGRGLNVDHLVIDNDDLTIEGRVLGADLLQSVERELQTIAKPGTLKKSGTSSVKAGAPGTPFGFTMKVSRKP